MANGLAVQSGRAFQLLWDFDPDEPVSITRTSESPNLVLATELPATTKYYVDIIDSLQAGDTVSWTILGLTSTNTALLSAVAGSPDEVPYTYGPINLLVDSPRYASLDRVHPRAVR